MRVAYIRVSTVEQNEARQIEAMKELGIEKYYTEKVSGKNMRDREQLKMMLDFVREGDEVYVADFSRLSRSVQDLLNIVDGLNKKGVRLVSLKENLDTSTATGKLMLTMIGAIAEFERFNLLERQREGIAIAKSQKKYSGRAPLSLDNWDEVYKEWQAKRISAVAACKLLGVSRGTFYNRVHRVESKGNGNSEQ
ncbi:MAG: recombinase family protein [Lachnospiraceae bacterium]|nr:recombinase family protein [Lachnospiraceae bacterium]